MRKIILIIFIQVTILSCGKKKSNLAPEPTAATLLSPINNEPCTTGTLVSNTESKITFNWTAGLNTSSFLITVTNLNTKIQQTYPINVNSATLTLQQNTPYSWFVTSKSTYSATTVNSMTWKFYNSGTGTNSFPPYPAEILNPLMGQIIAPISGKINLQWKGSDADNDIVNYDVYFGTTTSPALIQSKISTASLSNISVNSNTTYYWKVITYDSKGNSSDSGLFEFKTN